MCLSKVRSPTIINKCATKLPKWDVLKNKHERVCNVASSDGCPPQIKYQASGSMKQGIKPVKKTCGLSSMLN
jgi:hypothetical protein